MLNLSKMQRGIDDLLGGFIKLIDALDKNVSDLTSGIERNEEDIKTLEAQNVAYSRKIDEYTTLATNVKEFINRK